jgi:hypothetical protein
VARRKEKIMAQFYGQVGSATTPTNTFANNKKVKLVAANVADARVFTKASVSKMSQSEFAGKKFGRSYTLYIPGKPKVVNGVVADPSDVTEIETQVYLDNDNVSNELGPWQRLGDIESFQQEIAGPWATSLARDQEKKIVKHEIFKAMGAVVAPKTSAALDGADYSMLGKATAKLRKLALSSELVGFLDPDVEAEISDKAISNKFITSDSQFMKLYGENSIGKYATAGWVETPDLPQIKTKASAYTGSITLGTAAEDGNGNALGFAPITQISGTNLVAGDMFTVAGLKMVDTSGIQTDVPVQIIVLSTNDAGTVGYINPLRITFDGKAYGNPNAWVAADTESLTLVAGLKANTTYQICEVRAKDALAYDTYQFDSLPGSDEEQVATVGGSSVKMRIFGDGTNLNKLIRLDSAYAAAIYEPRNCVVIYVEM